VKFKLDENLPERVRDALTAQGLDAHIVPQEGLSGARDDAVLQACIAEGRILVTLDLDFADICAYPPGSHPASGCFVRQSRPFGPWRPWCWQACVCRRRSLCRACCG
jgi:hypothetical protein